MVLARAIPFWLNFILNLYSTTLLINNCKKQVATICVVFDLVCSWTLVENIVAKGGSELPSSIGQLNALQIFIYNFFPTRKQHERSTRLLANWMHFKIFDLCECFNLQELFMFIGQFNAFKELNLLRCFKWRELPSFIANWITNRKPLFFNQPTFNLMSFFTMFQL
jgi:hypothetical protein